MPYPENVAHLEATILQMCDGDIKSFMWNFDDPTSNNNDTSLIAE